MKYKVGDTFMGVGFPELTEDNIFEFTISEDMTLGNYKINYKFTHIEQTTIPNWHTSESQIDNFILRYELLNSPLVKALS